MQILGIANATFIEDYSDVKVQIRTDQSEGLVFNLTVDVLQHVLVSLGQALNIARGSALAKGNQGIFYSKVFDAKVQGLTGKGVVGLGISTEDGLIHYFAIPTDLSANLRPNMEKAEEIGRAKISSVRQ